MNKIFWVDEEESVTFPDIKYLEYKGFVVDQVACAGDALDWFAKMRNELGSFAAFIIDIQLPIFDDDRFLGERSTHGTFAGLRLCELVEEYLGPEGWRRVSGRFLLYTRLPNTSRMARIKTFAEDKKLLFAHKDGSLIDTLIENKLIDVK